VEKSYCHKKKYFHNFLNFIFEQFNEKDFAIFSLSVCACFADSKHQFLTFQNTIKISLCRYSNYLPMFVENRLVRLVRFTFLVGWHASAVSLHPVDAVLAQLACPLNDVNFCLRLELLTYLFTNTDHCDMLLKIKLV
jgi:hypothetical protein